MDETQDESGIESRLAAEQRRREGERRETAVGRVVRSGWRGPKGRWRRWRIRGMRKRGRKDEVSGEEREREREEWSQRLRDAQRRNAERRAEQGEGKREREREKVKARERKAREGERRTDAAAAWRMEDSGGTGGGERARRREPDGRRGWRGLVGSCVAGCCGSGATVLLRPPAVDFRGCPRGVPPREERFNPIRAPTREGGREKEKES